MKESKEKSLKRQPARPPARRRRRRRNFFMRARHKGNEECSRRVTFWSCWWGRAQAIMWRNAFESKSRPRALILHRDSSPHLSPPCVRRRRKNTRARQRNRNEREREIFIYTALLLLNIERDAMDDATFVCRHYTCMQCIDGGLSCIVCAFDRLTDWLTICESASWVCIEFNAYSSPLYKSSASSLCWWIELAV